MLLLLLPRLRHPSTSHTGIQLSVDDGGFSAQLKRVDVVKEMVTSTLRVA